MARFDTHQHFWSLANAFTAWPTPDLLPIYRDFGADDLRPELAPCGIEGTILVQAAPNVAETEYCLMLASTCDFVKGVVGWIDFEAADALDQLAWLASNPLLKALRPMVQAIDEPGWLLKPDFAPIFAAMVEWDLALDGLVLPHQIGDLDALARRHPDLRIVLDHAGKPPIASGGFDDWAAAITRFAQSGNVHCKLSGLWIEAGDDISDDSIRPWAAHVLTQFGPERVMWGSDWPVLTLAGRYADWLSHCEQLCAHCTDDERAAIFGGNGKRFYGID